MVLGLDAPAGTGNDANKERITLVADEKGGASITFKDRRTFVVSRMYLDAETAPGCSSPTMRRNRRAPVASGCPVTSNRRRRIETRRRCPSCCGILGDA
jgi:hypothetical protein